MFGFIWHFLSNRWLEVVLSVNSYKNDYVNAGVTPY